MSMELDSKKGIISVIENIIQEFERENPVPLKRISNEVIEDSATVNNFDLLYLGVITYILHKCLNQNHLVETKYWKKEKEQILSFLSNMKNSNNFKKELLNLQLLFKNQDQEFFNYIRSIERKGRIKAGARLYSMGFSQRHILALLNVNNYDLQNYLSDSQTNNQKKSEDLLRQKVDILSKEQRNLIFDSSALISIGNTGIISFFEEFKKRNSNVNLYLTQAVHNETIDIQDKVERYGWIGIQYEALIKKGIFKLIKKEELPKNGTLEEECNNIFYTKHGRLEILQAGELESVIFAKERNCVFVIDEITTRWLIDSPLKLHDLMEGRYKEKVQYDKFRLKKVSDILKNVSVVRSVDLIAFAIKQGYFDKFKGLDYKKSLLYSLKYSGCATTYEEIDNYLGNTKK